MPDAMRGKPVVEFLLVGAQKAGTTALHHMLRQHPDLFLPRRKELHFFDRTNKADWSNPDYAQYEQFFRHKMPHQVAGEATPIYSYWPPCMERISHYNPDVKLVYCLRHPAERAFSHWSMESARGKEPLPFAEAIREGRTRVLDRRRPYAGHQRRFSYVERGFYAQHLARMLETFDQRQLLVLTFESFQRDQRGFLDTVCRFLGVPTFETYPPNQTVLPVKPRGDNGHLQARDRAYLVELYRDEIDETERLTGMDLSAWRS